MCEIGECQSGCLSDLFWGDDAEMLASGTCDGYSALIAGGCSDVCPEDDEGALQQASGKTESESDKAKLLYSCCTCVSLDETTMKKDVEED